MSRQALDDAEVARLVADLPGWRLGDGGRAILRSFAFKDFRQAFAFMRRVAVAAEKLDHHPEWSNVYARVEVRLSTHDAGGLTELDFALAREMERCAAAANA